MYPNIPVPVWQQIAIVIVFAFLVVGLIWILVRIFSNTVTRATADTTQLFVKAIADVNQHYSKIIHDNNVQWQMYFDAKGEMTRMVDSQTVEKLDALSDGFGKLTSAIDQLSRQMESYEYRAEQRQVQLMGSKKKSNPNSPT